MSKKPLFPCALSAFARNLYPLLESVCDVDLVPTSTTPMKKNMSVMDRLIRLAMAIVLLSMYYVSYSMYSALNPDGWGLVFFILGCALTITSIFGFCPVYAPFGLCSIKNEPNGD